MSELTVVDSTLVREPFLHLIDRDIGDSCFGCWLPARRSAILAFGFAFATFGFPLSLGSVVLAFAFAFTSTLASAFADICRSSVSLGSLSTLIKMLWTLWLGLLVHICLLLGERLELASTFITVCIVMTSVSLV